MWLCHSSPSSPIVFVGGLRYKEQEFKQTAAQLNTGMLASELQRQPNIP